MKRGRPLKSEIRKNIVEILFCIRNSYGYEIAKLYNTIFPKVSQRVIYYHLKKGIDTEEFCIKDVKTEAGNYSWGKNAEKTYYCLGEKAEPKGNKSIRERIETAK